MKKVLKGVLEFLMCLWQLPQEVAGFVVLVFCFGWRRITKVQEFNTAIAFRISGFKGGLSLGRFIFVEKLDYKLICHEYGHSRQSKILGPLYLVVIGLPSLIWAWVYSFNWKKSYYWFYTERWADKLGKVNRKTA